jgi:alpha-D-xyloside xylohydrolase
MPVFVKEGSIIPYGPDIQYTTEKPADSISLFIYTGHDALFTLYEDEGDNYNYEKGLYSSITFGWNDDQKLLTIEDRKGEFPGMLKRRTFDIIFIGEDKEVGMEKARSVKTITYVGKRIVERF